MKLIKSGRYKGKLHSQWNGQDETRDIILMISENESKVSVSKANEKKKITVECATFADDGHRTAESKSIIADVCTIENIPLEEINNKNCLCCVFKRKVAEKTVKQYGSAIIQLNDAGELTKGEYWINGGTSGVITDLKLQDLKDEEQREPRSEAKGSDTEGVEASGSDSKAVEERSVPQSEAVGSDSKASEK